MTPSVRAPAAAGTARAADPVLPIGAARDRDRPSNNPGLPVTGHQPKDIHPFAGGLRVHDPALHFEKAGAGQYVFGTGHAEINDGTIQVQHSPDGSRPRATVSTPSTQGSSRTPEDATGWPTARTGAASTRPRSTGPAGRSPRTPGRTTWPTSRTRLTRWSRRRPSTRTATASSSPGTPAARPARTTRPPSAGPRTWRALPRRRRRPPPRERGNRARRRHGTITGSGRQSISDSLLNHHYYDTDLDPGFDFRLALRPLQWTEDGWPALD